MKAGLLSVLPATIYILLWLSLGGVPAALSVMAVYGIATSTQR